MGLNLLWLVPGVVGGSEEYTVRLLDAVLRVRPPGMRMTVFSNNRMASAYPELLARFDEAVIAPVSGSSKVLRVLAESTWLAKQVTKRHIDLVHHMGGIIPVLRPTPVIVTIHDLQPLAMPEHFTPMKRRFIRVMAPYAARHAGTVIALTSHTRHDIADRIGVPLDKIEIVPSGITIPAGPPDPGDLADLRAEYQLADRPFFLYPAITYPHKNHVLLLHAFAAVVRRHPEAMLLLTSGAAQMEEQVHATVERLGLRGNVRRPGRIPRADLDALYWACTALAFPSRYEGFGLPVLEAMARGCPVIAADDTALPEVVDDAGLLVDPRDLNAWSDAMLKVLTDEKLRESLRKSGYERAAHFSWPGAARCLIDIYRRELGL